MKMHIGLVGCGEWGKFILRDLKTLGCHVTVVYRSEKSRQFALEGGADALVNGISDLRNVDGIVIATQASTHLDVIQEVAQAYPCTPIFIEKPFAVSLEDAEMIAHHYPDHVFVMHKWQYHPGILALAALVKDQRLGRLLGVHLTRLSCANHHPDVDMIWTCMPHDLSIVYEILGHIPPIKSSIATQWGSETMALTSFWGQDPWVKIEVSTIRQAKLREVRLECEQGIAILADGYAEQIEIYHRDSHTNQLSLTPEILAFSPKMPLFVELEAFVGYLQGGAPLKTNAQQGLEVVRAIVEARQRAGVHHTGVLI